jgi:hypothetical protein
VFLYVDFTAPVEAIRAKFMEIVQSSKLWDGQVAKLQVTDSKESSIELRALASARSTGDAFDLRCDIREQLIDFVQEKYPTALPHGRGQSLPADTRGTTGDHQHDDERPTRNPAHSKMR